jgi:Kdo2-lipid IVA lauroyltransferase/acyltransferase
MLLTGHFTHTELAVRLVVEALGRPVRGVVRRNNNACLEATFEAARAAHFGPTLEKKDVRGLLRTLQSAQAVAYSADQNFNFQHVFVPFFGVPAATLTTVPALVRRADAVLLPLWFHRDTTGRYRIEIAAAWDDWTALPPADAAAFYMRELEARVRAHPDQYLWVHRRFKTRPKDEDRFY